jgi:hypothetical protein
MAACPLPASTIPNAIANVFLLKEGLSSRRKEECLGEYMEDRLNSMVLLS